MTNEVKNVPELRFPEYSEEWEKKRLKDISKINPKLMNEFPSEFDYIDLESVYKGKINKVSRVTNENAPSRAQRVAQRGDVFFQTVRPYQQNNFVFLDDRYSTVVSTGYAQIRSNMNSFYIYNLLLTSTFLNKVLINCTGSNYPAINSNDLGNISIRISTNENEKQKIGEFFSKLDQQIELEEQKLEKLEKQKKGYMQQIFSQQLRFKGENGNDYPEWKKEIIGNIATTFSGGTPSSTNSTFYTGEIPFIRSGEISKTSTELMINEKAISNSSAKMVETGDLLYALYGATSGEVAISKINGAINQAVLCIRSQESIAYIFNYLKMKKDQILKTYIQGGQGNLSASIIKKVDIDLPSLKEQKLIGHFFNKFDDYIEIQSDKVELLKERKKGFLQKMFV